MKIPNRVRVTSKVDYEVVFINEFKDGNTLGECRLETKQIVLNTNQSKTELLKSFLHELAHAASEEYGIGLTEPQVLKSELALYKVLKLNGWLK